METEKRSFGGKISNKLKVTIDSQIEQTKLPIGRIVEALAEMWAEMTEDDQKHLCYGINSLTFTDFINSKIIGFLQSPEGLTKLAAELDETAIEAARKKQKRNLHRHKSAESG